MIINFSDLQIAFTVSSDDQLLIRLNNSLSGLEGFARTTALNFQNSLPALSSTGVSAGIYGNAFNTPVLNIDSKGRVLSAANVSNRVIPITESLTAHSLILSEENSVIKTTNVSGCVLNIANTSTINYPVGFSFILARNIGAGALSVAVASGTLPNSNQLPLVLGGQSIGIYHEGSNVWRCL